MLQVGSNVRVKRNAYEGSDEPKDFEVRVGDEWFILSSSEVEEIEFTETITPDTPQNQEFAAMIRQGIETLGWDEFEQQFVEAMELYLVAEGGGKRYYERADGQVKMTIGNFLAGEK